MKTGEGFGARTRVAAVAGWSVVAAVAGWAVIVGGGGVVIVVGVAGVVVAAATCARGRIYLFHIIADMGEGLGARWVDRRHEIGSHSAGSSCSRSSCPSLRWNLQRTWVSIMHAFAG